MILKAGVGMTAVYNLMLYDIVFEDGYIYTVVSIYENGDKVVVTYACQGCIEKRLYRVDENVYTIKEYSIARISDEM